MKSRHASAASASTAPCRRLVRSVGRLAGAQQRLGRDACPVRALPPDQLTFDESHPQSAVGQLAGAVLARRAAADDDDVVVRGHRRPRARGTDGSAIVRAPCTACTSQTSSVRNAQSPPRTDRAHLRPRAWPRRGRSRTHSSLTSAPPFQSPTSWACSAPSPPGKARP